MDDAAQPVTEVARAGRALRDALDDPATLALAADRLAGAAEDGLARLDAAGAAPGLAPEADDPAGLLAAALSHLDIAGTMLAASRAVGEHGPPEPEALDGPLRRIDATATLLAGQAALAVPAAPPRSTSVAEAAASLKEQLDRTVEDIVSRSTTVIGGSLTGIHDRGPAAVRRAWDLIDQKLHLDQIGGKLARIGLRALRGALAMLARIVPAAWLTDVRARVDRLIAAVDRNGPGRAVVAAVLGADHPPEPAAPQPSTVDVARLDRGTGDLAALAASYGRLMDLCGGIGSGIGVAATVAGALRLAIPQLGAMILAAHVLLVGCVVVLGRDHIDAGAGMPAGHGLVRGVRTIVAEATG